MFFSTKIINILKNMYFQTDILLYLLNFLQNKKIIRFYDHNVACSFQNYFT